MKLFHIKRINYDYDEPTQVVVLAEDEPNARHLAASIGVDELEWAHAPAYRAEFGDPTKSTCEEIPATLPVVVIEHWIYG